MAFASGNADRPRGLIPLRHGTGGIIRTSSYTIAGGLSTAIGQFDLVKPTGTGKNIDRAAAGDRAIGVFLGCHYLEPDGTVRWSNQWPASQAIRTGSTVTAIVVDDPDVIFTIQVDENFTAAKVGNTGNIVAGAVDTATGVSGMTLGTLGTDADRNLRTIGLVDREDNAYGVNAEVEVMIQKHYLRSAATAI